MRIFAACSPGLESLLAGEVSVRLPRLVAVAVPGGVEFDGGLEDVWRANLWLRTASRILVRLGEFPAVGWPELIRKASRLDWGSVLGGRSCISFRVTCRQSRLYHSGAVEERILQAVAKALGREVRSVSHDEEADAEPQQIVVVRIFRDICTVSLDSSGLLLHKRGYKLATGKAPLRENLAAALVLASGWDRESPFLDPFCGAGTIPIEAAHIGLNIPPGGGRRFAFMDWPDFDAKAWDGLLRSAEKERRSFPAGIFAGSDRDAGAVASSRANAERAGVADYIRFEQKSLSDIQSFVSGSGWIVTNPPYGKRIRGRDLRDLYARFGTVLASGFSGSRVSFLAPDARLAGEMKLPLERVASFAHGGLKIGCYSGRIP